MLNWFGREPHPSDELIHWSDQPNFRRGWGAPVGVDGNFKTFDEYVDALRAAWDFIKGDKVDTKTKAAFELVLAATAHKQSMEAGEDAAGEDL